MCVSNSLTGIKERQEGKYKIDESSPHYFSHSSILNKKSDKTLSVRGPPKTPDRREFEVGLRVRPITVRVMSEMCGNDMRGYVRG